MCSQQGKNKRRMGKPVFPLGCDKTRQKVQQASFLYAHKTGIAKAAIYLPSDEAVDKTLNFLWIGGGLSSPSIRKSPFV